MTTTETDMRTRLEKVVAELDRNGWHVDPIDPDAPGSVVHARLLIEERRLRVLAEAAS